MVQSAFAPNINAIHYSCRQCKFDSIEAINKMLFYSLEYIFDSINTAAIILQFWLVIDWNVVCTLYGVPHIIIDEAGILFD